MSLVALEQSDTTLTLSREQTVVLDPDTLFDVNGVEGSVVELQFAGPFGIPPLYFELYDRPGLAERTTKKTAKNFLNYVNQGLYNGSIIHRAVPDFIIQGGGFSVADGVTPIESLGPLKNEPGNSNVRGTVAMAKIGGDPNSATNQWFINLNDNSSNLDEQNGGFTVFGEVLGSSMEVADAISQGEIIPATDINPAFNELPVWRDETNQSYFFQIASAKQIKEGSGIDVSQYLDSGNASFSINGSTDIGSILSITKVSSDPDGDGSFSYTWQTSTDSSGWSIAGAGPDLTITANMEGNQVRLLTTYTDAQGFDESVFSDAITVSFRDDGDAFFTINGSTSIGSTLSINKDSADPDGDGSFSHTWQSSTDGSSWSNAGTGSDLSINAALEGQQIRVLTAYTDAQGFHESVISEAVTVQPEPEPADSAPSLYKATVNGNQVTLQFNEELATTLPTLGKFEFTSGVNTYRATDASVNAVNGTVVLTLNKPVQAGRALQMSYFDLSSDQKINVIQSTTGVDWSRQESLNIENRTTEDLQLSVEDAEFTGNQIQIYLDGPSADTLPLLKRFKVKAGKKKQRVTDVDIDAAEGVVTLTTKKDLSLYESISISYKDLKRDQLSGVIEDEFGNDMKTFKGYEVLNPNYVDEPPSLVNVEYDDGEITIEFDSVLDFGKVNKRRFKVSADSKRLRVKSAVVDREGDSFVILQTATKRNQIIDLETDMRLSYSDPRGDQGRNVIEDLFGNDVSSFTDQIVTVI